MPKLIHSGENPDALSFCVVPSVEAKGDTDSRISFSPRSFHGSS